MNNSDYNDFLNWQNGDDEPTPGSWYYFGPLNEEIKKMWENKLNNDDPLEHLKDYLNVNDMFAKNQIPKYNKKETSRSKRPNMMLTQEEYFKLIEIRGYLAINEQFAHVKALDKVLNTIKINYKESK